MTYRDPNEPLGTDSPTEAYRAPAPGTPAGTQPPAAWPGQHEPTTTPAVTVPATGPRSNRPNRARWAVALVVIALVVAASGVAAVLLTGKAPEASVLGWVPAENTVYAEMRLDLPGDQRANLGEFLSRFPGFKDQAALDTKINEVLDRLVSSASDGEQTYTADIAPWFDGELAMSVGKLPDPAALSDPNATPEAPEAVAFLSLKDGAKAQAWFDDIVGGADTTTETYKDTTLTLVSAPESEVKGGTAAFGIPAGGKVAILGQVDAVKRALDTNGASTLAADPEFAAALASAESDHVGYLYLNVRSYMDWALGLAPEAMAGQCGASFSEDLSAMVPEWVAMSTRVEKDALALNGSAPLVDDPPVVQENRTSSLASRLPASTLVFAEGHDIGETLLATVDMYREDPACAEALQQVDMAVGFLGGFDNLLGWAEDAAIVVNRTGDGVEGGLVFQATDGEDAADLFETIKSLLAFAGAGGPSVREETHGDATITVLDLGDAASLSEMGGGMTGVPVPAPADSDARVELAWTVSDNLVVVGIGTNFIKSVLDTEEGSSLAADPRFKGLLDRVGGASNTGVTYADLGAMREMLEGLIQQDADSLAEYEAEAKPFLAPFDAFIQAGVVNGDRADTKAIITVK